MTVQVGDSECLRSVSASSMNRFVRFTVHKSIPPFLGEIGGGLCAGVVVRRYGRQSVGVTCFTTGLDDWMKIHRIAKYESGQNTSRFSKWKLGNFL